MPVWKRPCSSVDKEEVMVFVSAELIAARPIGRVFSGSSPPPGPILPPRLCWRTEFFLGAKSTRPRLAMTKRTFSCH